MKTVRFTTLIKRYGIPAYLDSLDSLDQPKNARARFLFKDAIQFGKILTIHHAETANGAFWAEPGKHAVNVVGFAIFNTSIPKDIGYVIGVESQLGKLRELMEMEIVRKK